MFSLQWNLRITDKLVHGQVGAWPFVHYSEVVGVCNEIHYRHFEDIEIRDTTDVFK